MMASTPSAIIRPSGDGHISLVGRIKLPDWEHLLGVMPRTSEATPESQGIPKQYASATIPDTPAGRLARSYLEVFNSADSSRTREFIEHDLVPNPARTTEARMEAWRKTFEAFGPLAVLGVRSSSPNELALDVRSRTGEMVLTTTTSPQDPARAASITLGTIQRGHP